MMVIWRAPNGVTYVDAETWSPIQTITGPTFWLNTATSTPQTGTTIWEPRLLIPRNMTTSVYHDMYTNQPLWEEAVTPTQYYDLACMRVHICRERTEAENRRLEEEQRLREEAARRREEERHIAGRRAKELLLSHLTPEQQRTFEENNWFIVKGGKSGTRYRIGTNRYAGNIEVLHGDKAVARLCCHCYGDIPLHDQHMAQMLALRWDEDRFLGLANRSAA